MMIAVHCIDTKLQGTRSASHQVQGSGHQWGVLIPLLSNHQHAAISQLRSHLLEEVLQCMKAGGGGTMRQRTLSAFLEGKEGPLQQGTVPAKPHPVMKYNTETV